MINEAVNCEEAVRLLRLDEVCERTTLSRMSIHRHRQAGTFPAPFRLAGNRIAFSEQAVSAWIAERAPARGHA